MVGVKMINTEYYFCSKNIYFPQSDVIEQIINIYILSNYEISFETLYFKLKSHYKVQNFNRKKLVLLIVQIGKLSKTKQVVINNELIKSTSSNKGTLIELVTRIAIENYNYKLEFFFNENSTNEFKKIDLNTISDLIEYVCNDNSIDFISYEELLNNIKFLFVDLKHNIHEILIDLIGELNSKKFDVISKRSKGKTLAEIAEIYKVSRERIRQIEFKVIDDFFNNTNKLKREIIVTYLELNAKSKYYLDYRELESIIGEYGQIILFMFDQRQNLNCTEKCLFHYKEVQIVNLSCLNWLDTIKEKLNELNEVIDQNEFDDFAYNLKDILNEKEEIFTLIFIKNILNKYLIKNGRFFTKANLGVTQKYNIILEKHFKSGLKIYEKNSLEEFKKKFYVEFNDDSIFHKTNRSISARLSDIGSQIDKGTYVSNCYAPKISDINLKRIGDFIEGQGKVILTKRIYNEFRNELLNDNINNRFLLHAELKNKLENKYYFKRNYIAKSKEAYNIIDELELYLSKQKGFLNIKDLESKFPSVNNIFVLTYLSNNSDYISAFNQRWINIKDLDIKESEIDILFNILNDLLDKNNQVSAKQVMEETRIVLPRIFLANLIEYQFFFFGILQSLFSNQFEFNRPYISSLGKPFVPLEEQLKEFIRGNDFVFISDIKDYVDKNNIKVNNYSVLITELNDEFLRVDKDILYSVHLTGIDDEKISDIGKSLEILLDNKEKINSNSVYYSIFPDIGFEWNGFLLSSIIQKYFTNTYELEAINTTDYRYEAFTINQKVNKGMGK